MLIVKDFEKLEKHGFKKVSRWESDIWELVLAEDADSNTISLLVNPLYTERKKDEMFVYATTSNNDYDDKQESMDMCARIDIIFEMIADGTIEYVKEEN